MSGWQDHALLRDIHAQLDLLGKTITRIEKKLDNLTAQEHADMSKLDDSITTLQADVAADTSAVNSAVTMLNGINSQIAAAVQAALAAGATDAQLQALTDLQTTIANNTTSLATAVAANTPAAK